MVTSLVLGGLAFRVWALEPVLERLGAAPKTLDLFGRALRGRRWPCWPSSASPRRPASYGIFSTVAAAGWRPTFGGIGKAGALALLRLFLVPMIGYLAAPAGSSGMALAFAALLVLTRAQAGHAANGGLGPVLVDAVAPAGRLHLAGRGRHLRAGRCRRCSVSGPLQPVPVGVRFGQLALASAGLAMLSGIASGWMLGLDPTRLTSSRYGLALLVEARADRAAAGRRVRGLAAAGGVPGPRLPRLPLTAELILGAGVLLTAGALALLPPPGETSTVTPLDLVQPAGAGASNCAST